MSQEKTTLEVIAPTVDEAVQKGLAQLNLSQEAVEVEVLDAGSKGLFGLGSRQARIRLTLKSSDTPGLPAIKPTPSSQPAQVEAETKISAEPQADQAASDVQASSKVETPEEMDETLATAVSVVSELLEKMTVRANVSASYHSAEDEDNEQAVLVNIEGNDLSILIGRRSETLNALQYITSLILSKRLDRWVQVMIDVQGYRARRERQLRQIARRMAEQAVHTGRRQVLEPMPANERRLIHLELRDHPGVETESIGDEPNRKVTISLKK